MKMKNILAKSQLLRLIFFPILRKLDFEIRWKHDITKRPVSLLTWLHKGYWYYGLDREFDEVERFRELINDGDCVLEVGGHIGYVTQIFEDLVGSSGIVYVAEPTPFSRYFLAKNVSSNTTILPIALSDVSGNMDFYIEEFGGFTNSLVSEFTETSSKWLKASQNKSVTEVKKIKVDVNTIDLVSKREGITPNFIKIDVEGAELSVLKGAEKTLLSVDALMVEISRNHEEIYELLYRKKFKAKKKNGNLLASHEHAGGNIFFYK